MQYKCSKCNHIFEGQEPECPYCGAKMEYGYAKPVSKPEPQANKTTLYPNNADLISREEAAFRRRQRMGRVGKKFGIAGLILLSICTLFVIIDRCLINTNAIAGILTILAAFGEVGLIFGILCLSFKGPKGLGIPVILLFIFVFIMIIVNMIAIGQRAIY